jgi:hypothetical protein
MSDRVIRFASDRDKEDIVGFLRDHWDPNFSVVQSRELFDFLYLDGNKLNFVLALSGADIVAILGFCIYDDTHTDLFLMLWRSIDTKGTTGIDLIRFLQAQGFRSISSVGVRKEVLPIYELLGFNAGSLDQWVRINQQLESFEILGAKGAVLAPSACSVEAANCREVTEFDPAFWTHEKVIQRVPFKSWSYVTKRYCRHPIYRYRIFEVTDQTSILNYFVTRTVEHRSASALRLVDALNDENGLQDFSRYIDFLFQTEQHEYIDFYCLNFSELALTNAAFVNCRDLSNVIVPNFFEPFVQKAETKYFVSTLEAPKIFKGDGDADRPFRLMS